MRDAADALSVSVLRFDAGDDLGWETRLAAGKYTRPLYCSCRLPSRSEEALKLVDRDEALAPVHLHGLDEGENTTLEGRGADPECLCCLGARVGEPLDPGCLAKDCELCERCDFGRYGSLGVLGMAAAAPM
jgi:hypothetical protein